MRAGATLFMVWAMLGLIWTGNVNAQQAAGLAANSADSLTLGDYCTAVRNALRQPAVRDEAAAQLPVLEMRVAQVCAEPLQHMSLREATGSGSVSLTAVARLERSAYGSISPAVLDTAMGTLRAALRGVELRVVVQQAIGDSANRAFVAVVERANLLFLGQARDSAVARINRYAHKLGPSSPELNGVEVLLNYSAQRWVPGFRGSVATGPSPLEVIAAYAPGWATASKRQLTAVSAVEFGLRWYLFCETCGSRGLTGVLRPGHVSLGALVTGEANGALRWPWDAAVHTGVFVAWGGLKIAYVPNRNGKMLVTRQFQAIPFLF